jgi:hypothetical protein
MTAHPHISAFSYRELVIVGNEAVGYLGLVETCLYTLEQPHGVLLLIALANTILESEDLYGYLLGKTIRSIKEER